MTPPTRLPLQLATCLALLCLVPPQAAQEPSPDPAAGGGDEMAGDDAPVTSAESLLGRGQRHLLHTRDGKILRVEARLDGDTWRIRSGKTWLPLPVGSVQRAVLEKDVLGRARELQKELGNEDDPRRLVAYCDWLVREGLYTESMRELDNVLRKTPDEPGARDLLRRARLPIKLPEIDTAPERAENSLKRFLVRASVASPVVREVAVQRLLEAGEIPGLQETLAQELLHKSPLRRSFAAFCLRRALPGREVRPLLARAVLDASNDVRRDAALALRDVGDPAVILPVVRALGSRNNSVRRNAIEALGTMGYPAAVEPLMTHLSTLQSSGTARAPHANVFVGTQLAYVSDFDVEVSQGVAAADPSISVLTPGTALDAGVLNISTFVLQTERATARRALEQLTGASPGHTTEAWERWWEEHGGEWKAEHAPPSTTSSPRSPGD